MTISEETRDLWKKVKDNSSVLKSCAVHNFGRVEIKSILVDPKLKCTLCGGEMRVMVISHYVDGYRAAGGKIKDIIDSPFFGEDR